MSATNYKALATEIGDRYHTARRGAEVEVLRLIRSAMKDHGAATITFRDDPEYFMFVDQVDGLTFLDTNKPAVVVTIEAILDASLDRGTFALEMLMNDPAVSYATGGFYSVSADN